MQRRELGIAVIGAGRIGTLRAILAARHPAVRFLAVADRDPERARQLAGKTRAWLDHLSTGSQCVLATAADARRTIEITLGIGRSLATGAPVRLPLAA